MEFSKIKGAHHTAEMKKPRNESPLPRLLPTTSKATLFIIYS